MTMVHNPETPLRCPQCLHPMPFEHLITRALTYGSQRLTEAQPILPEPELHIARDIFEQYQAPYTLAMAEDLLTLHQNIGSLNQAENSFYYHFTRTERDTTTFPEGLHFVSKPLAQFSAPEIAVMIHEQMRAYILKETMGHLPTSDFRKVQELLMIMISGYSADTLCVMARQNIPGNDFATPIAMARASIGICSRTVSEEIGSETSNLPTLTALNIPVSRLRERNQDLADTPCSEVICIGRLAVSHQAIDNLKLSGSQLPRLPLQVLGYMGKSLAELNTVRDKPLKYIIYDTHQNSGVAEMSRKFFGGQVIAGPDELEDNQAIVTPTAITNHSVLDFHYGRNGHQGKIYWMYTSVESFIAGGRRLVKEPVTIPTERPTAAVEELAARLLQRDNLTLGDSKPVLLHDASPEQRVQIERAALYYTEQPFEVARAELFELAGFYEAKILSLPDDIKNIPEAFKAEILGRVTRQIPETDRASTTAELATIFSQYDFLFKDTLNYARALTAAAKEFREHPETGTIHLYWPESRTLSKYVSEKIHSLLRRSRMLGLVSFDTLDTLAKTRTAWIGTSVAAQSIDLLVAYGNQHLSLIDGGKLEVSNGPRLTPEMGSVLNLGRSKAQTLLRSLYQREPFGHFKAIDGMIITGSPQQTKAGKETSVHDFTQDADLIIEVIDNPMQKIGLRLALQAAGRTTDTIFIADISPIPVAGLEQLQGNFFNQDLTHSDWQTKLQSVAALDNPLAQKAAALRLITDILGSGITEQHTISTLMIAAGAQGFLAQDPADTRVSATITSRLVLDLIEGKATRGKTYTLGELENRYLAEEINRQMALNVLRQSLSLK